MLGAVWFGALLAGPYLFAVGPSQPASSSFDFQQLCEHAKRLSTEAMNPVRDTLPEGLERLSYDEYRQIRFQADQAIWRSERLPFQLQLFHLGYLFTRPVDIHIIEGGRIAPVRYQQRLFTYPDRIDPAALPETLGFAGFRAHYPLNRPDHHDEVIAFLGASYFRAVSRDQVYGASCRGLAVDAGLGSKEEFPHFDAFWIVRPVPEARTLTIYALMTSPSLTGAYQFSVQPGDTTRIQVQACLYLRRDVIKLGIAPLTSMFLYGEATPRPPEDFRPEVHDSDGLLIAADNGEWIWRPLMKRQQTQVSRFEITRLRGFGLLQRDRDLEHYEDLEAHYEKRPSIWIEPDTDWPEGSVELLELTAAAEGTDNIAAYWVPRRAEPEMRVTYRLGFLSGNPPAHPGAKAISTRVMPTTPGRWRVMIDFHGPALQAMDAGARIEGVVSGSRARIEHVLTRKNPRNGSWRLVFDSVAEGHETVELRAFLKSGDNTLSETWSATWQPK